ncbi:MAG TPA: TonB-dependent receptor, partial [Novosphingobium sp.]|nr:TonB-dependent receptor [Novosphingobium sp.]
APLLADLPMVRKLELNGAVRQTHYSRSSPGLSSSSLSVTTWKVGAVYEPFDMLRLRVTRSRDIRAPNISELFGPVTSGRTTVVDPANGGTQVQVTSYTGANPLLQPEKADTFTVGAVLQPRIPFGRSLNLSVDYFDISINGAISTLGAQTVVNRCNSGASEYCPYVSRDGSGNLLQVQDLLQNVNGQKVRGIDINFAYSTHKGPWGSLDFNVMATRYLEFSTRDSAGVTDRVCQTGFRPGTTTGVPCWIVDGNLGWNIGKVRANLHGRYIPPGKFDVLLVGPEDPGYSPSLSNSVNTNRVAGRFYLDMGLNVKVNDQFEVFGVVNNLFDTDPSMAASAQGGTNQVYFDPIGRNFKFGARVRM